MRLEPDGFEFVAPVLLQVTLPTGSGVSPEREIPLSITGNKNLVSLGLLEPDAAQPTFFIQHFSSYAVVLSQKGMNATLSESEVRSRFGGDELERIQTATAEKLARERQRQLLGQDDGEVQIDFDEIFKQMESVAGGDVLATKDIAFSENDGTESIQGPVNMVLFHKPLK